MMCRPVSSWLLVLMLSMLVAGSDAAGQQSHVSSRGPRFFLAGWSAGHELDGSAAPVLRRRVSLDLTDATIGEALKEVTRQADLEISYSPRVVPLNRPVSLHAQGITVAAALTEILLDVPVDVSITAGGGLALVPRSRAASVLADTGTVVGQVSDSANGFPIVGATVSIEGTRRSTVTDAGGRYRISLLPGTYTVRARYIGYVPAKMALTVRAEEETTADFRLGRSAQELNQLVVTGTIVPTEVKALPTPVSVITEEDIALRRPRTVAEVFRQAIPGAVAWDFPVTPIQTAFSARGTSTLNTGSGQMKVFVDGIETASPTFAAVDPNSIERIEVIRGPQAAAIYGSDAIGGVIQIFTKRGDPNLARPRVNAEAALGLVQTPYSSYDGVLRQTYAASVRGGGTSVSYNVGARYSHTDDYLPIDDQSRQSNPGAYGGLRFARGGLTVDISGRDYTQNTPNVFNPALLQSGFAFYSKPLYQPAQYRSQTLGMRVGVEATSSWQHVVTFGVDRYTLDLAQTRPRLTTAADTLLLVFNQSQTKTSIGYNTSVQGALGFGLAGSITAGLDHWNLPNTSFSVSGATTTGSLNGAVASRTITNNTGYFVQGQLGIRDALFLTSGVRVEESNNFGDSLGTPVSPRVGLSYVQPIRGATLKLRGSWGRAIRAPTPGLKLPAVSAIGVVLANPQLGPERQRGWDAGADVTFGARGSLSATYYDQTADNLIQQVLLQSIPQQTFQWQNVGAVRNTGVELEAALSLGFLELKGQYGYSRARVAQLAPNYTGDLRVGEQTLLTPRHTVGASTTLFPFGGTAVAAGLTYVGSWTQYDFLARFRCFGGTGPCQPTSRGYLIGYPGFIKINATLSHQINPLVSSFLSVDNLTNNEAFEFYNFTPVLGRTTTVGLRFQY